MLPLLCDPAAGSTASPFGRAFAARAGHAADCAAAQSYDATWLLITALREAGLNRARVRDAVEALSPWGGVAGPVEWDKLGRNRRLVRLGTVRGDRLVEVAASRR